MTIRLSPTIVGTSCCWIVAVLLAVSFEWTDETKVSKAVRSFEYSGKAKRYVLGQQIRLLRRLDPPPLFHVPAHLILLFEFV